VRGVYGVMRKREGKKAGAAPSLEATIPKQLASIFEKNESSTSRKLDHFPKYIRRQRITRLLALYELFKLILPVKGSIVECGVNEGFCISCWNHFSSILEPNNITRRIYGFDTFEGFSSISKKDKSKAFKAKEGDLRASSFEELTELFEVHDQNRFLGHLKKTSLIKGDVTITAPEFISEHPHLLVSMLFLDMDIYLPTKVAIEQFVPRMPRGAIIAFDELDNPIWPGETLALLDTLGIGRLEIKRFEFDPYIGYARIE
jgi:Macrocin-O-methyltransferase (TylF)